MTLKDRPHAAQTVDIKLADCDSTGGSIVVVRLGLAEVRQHRVDELKSCVDLLTDLGAGKDNLARHEDEEHNLRLHHAVDETREKLWLVTAESMMARSKTLETNGELDVTRAHNVLYAISKPA